MTNLLGFYRDSGEISSVFSGSPDFFEYAMDQTYRAFVKPLVFHSIDSEWTSLANLYTSHPVLDEIIKKKIVFHTALNNSDNPQLIAGYSCGVLMHAPADDLAMCRTGVLVVKENDGWCQLLLNLKGNRIL